MKASQRRLLLWSVLGGAVALALFWAFRPQPVPVDLHTVARGAMLVTVNEEGETRVRDIFVLSAPVAGRLLRIEAEAGDEVFAGETVIAQLEPVDPQFLDFRSEAQARAAIRAAESGLELAQSEVDQARAELDFARADVDRSRELIRENTISRRDLDEAERRDKTAKAAYSTALAALQVRTFELERARAALLSPARGREPGEECECVPITAPVNGRVLRLINESERVVPAGEPLVEIGDPGDLEIVADLLSADAVRVEPGQRVIVDDWGGDRPLEGRVRRVEPFGFTKVSALGIEEQRVNVIIDLVSPREDWVRLGHGYQVDLRIALWERDDVVTLPLTGLFRAGDDWAVFVEDGGLAVLRPIEVGRRNGLEAEIVSGLQAGERIIMHPGERVADGARIVARN